MSRIAILCLMSLALLYGVQTQSSPSSPDEVQGKSVYVPPAPPVDVVEEGCVQKDDENVTGHGRAK